MIGALIAGPLADRIGRKRIIVASTTAYWYRNPQAFTILVRDATWLMALRLLTGLDLVRRGCQLPVAVTSEFSLTAVRATMVMAMFAGFSIGAALGGLLCGWQLISAFGWRSRCFWLAAFAPLFLVPVLLHALPESIQPPCTGGRARSRGRRAAAARHAGREPCGRRPLCGAGAQAVRLCQWSIFSRSSGALLPYCSGSYSSWQPALDPTFSQNWLPTVLNDLGVSVSVAAAIGAMLQVGGVVGTFCAGLLHRPLLVLARSRSPIWAPRSRWRRSA